MSPLRILTALVSVGLVACVSQIDDLSPEERAEIDEANSDLDQVIGVQQQALKDSDYDKKKADNLGQKASAGAGARSQHKCYSWVKKAMRAAGFTLPPMLNETKYGLAAASFTTFGAEQPAALAKMGFQHVSIKKGEKHPQGTIVVYPRGNCGYSQKYGHIEIVCDAGGTKGCSDFKGNLGALKACATPTYFLPTGTTSSADSCADKEDGAYCSGLDNKQVFTCKNKTHGTNLQCESGKTCGQADAKVTVSGTTAQCNASATNSSSSSSSSGAGGGGDDGTGSGGGEDEGSSSSGSPASSSSGGSDPGGGTSGGSDPGGSSGSGEPQGGDSGEPSSSTGNWSCNGLTGQTIPSDGQYWMTTFGASDATSGTTCDDPGDNCIGACQQAAVQQNFCTASEATQPAICERKVKWFVADADRYGCGSRVKVEQNGKAVVALVIDRGPNCRIERLKSSPVLDASPAVNTYLSGRAQNGVGGARVTVTEVTGDTPLGPVNQ